MLHRTKLDVKLAGYAVGGSAALHDPTLVTQAQDYRRMTAARMIPLEASDIGRRFAKADYHVSLKVDGEFNLLVWEGSEAILVNPGGTVRTGLPLLAEAGVLLKKAGVKKAKVAGELWFHRTDKRARVHDVSRAARNPQSQAELDGLRFAAFDLVELDGPVAWPFAEVWTKLESLFGTGRSIAPVESTWLENGDAAGIEKLFAKWVAAGAEGAVVRSDAVGRFKLKPRHTIDAVVIGYTEGSDDRTGMIHDLLVALLRPDGSLHVVGHVGGGFTEADRRGFLSDLKDIAAESDYVEVNDAVAYRMVKPEWVIEISILDCLSQSTRGLPIPKMTLTYDAKANRYAPLRRLPSVGLISPQFVRRREDKRFARPDVRMEQVAELVEVPLLDKDATRLELPKSEILKREVGTKVLKGQTMVRKLLLIQTNKSADNPDHPAYVIHATDFSPGRRTPLERDIRVSNSREQIDGLYRELSEEYFVKGWAMAGAPPAEKPAPAKKPRAKKAAE